MSQKNYQSEVVARWFYGNILFFIFLEQQVQQQEQKRCNIRPDFQVNIWSMLLKANATTRYRKEAGFKEIQVSLALARKFADELESARFIC